MKTRAFVQVDVFTAEPYRGNPLAVVLDAQGLDDDRMQQFARWTNLSETVFLFPPTDANADYHVRIYTPGRELPFAGHPTLGSCHAWLAAGGRARAGDEVVQQCGAGLVRIRRDGERLSFAAPPLRRGDVEPETLHAVVRALGVDAKSVRAAQWLDNGPRWLSLLLDDAHTVLKLDPDQAALKSLPNVGVVAPHAAGGDCEFEVRGFAASLGVSEDPVTGSLNAGLGQWLIEAGVAPERYVAAQGTRLGRAGRVHVQRRDGVVWVGGSSVTCIEGRVAL
jgi:PhzF family phenazine biosynthesis protein